MLAYFIRRCLLAVLTLFCVTVLVYILVRSMPGDPFATETEKSTKAINQDDLKRKRAIYGLDDPLHVGYLKWAGNFWTGNLGYSFNQNYAVADEIKKCLGPTLKLSITSFLLAYVFSIPLGIYLSAKSGSAPERSISTFLYMLYSMPSFVVAMLLQSFFGVYLRDTWAELPLYGDVSTNYKELSFLGQVWDEFKHMILPTFCFTYAALAYECRFIKAQMAEVIRQDYIRTARAKGVSEMQVYWLHAFRNTLIPLVTLIGITFPTLLSGSVILETIFNWPGLGTLLLKSIEMRDLPVIMALVTIYSIMTLFGQLLADLLYAVVDPRIVYN